jgi:hypothetical protein
MRVELLKKARAMRLITIPEYKHGASLFSLQIYLPALFLHKQFEQRE